LKCNECGDSFVEVVENDSSMEDINTFRGADGSQSQENSDSEGSEDVSPLGSLLGQVLGMAGLTGMRGRQPGNSALLMQAMSSQAGPNLVIMGTNGNLGGLPGGGDPGFGGISGLMSLLGGGLMGPPGGASAIGDYAFGNISTIIEQLIRDSPGQHGPPPAAQTVIENLGVVSIDQELVDARTECAVCKDVFAFGETAKEVPCKHLFHEGCIIPWLKQTNSCPICRMEMPTDDEEYERYRASRHVQQQAASGAGN